MPTDHPPDPNPNPIPIPNPNPNPNPNHPSSSDTTAAADAAPIEPAASIQFPQDDDADSVLGGESVNSTESLSASIFEYRALHGRTYQANRDYWAPNDEQQSEGLDILHHAFVMLLGDQLFLAPIGDNPGRVLDVGTGTGIWAIDFADQFPGAEVIGTDITATQPTWVPPNLKFMIDDCLQEWTWPENHFDFVHLRGMYGSITDWAELYRRAFKHVKPGGWLQDMEMNVRLESDHVEIPADHVFNKWAELFYEGGDKMGRSFAIACDHRMRDHMEAAGFVDIVERKIKAPCHGWPKDQRLRQAGLLIQAGLEESLDGFAIYLLTQVLGWSKEETFVLLAKMRAEVRRKANCAWCHFTIVYGRKPLDAA